MEIKASLTLAERNRHREIIESHPLTVSSASVPAGVVFSATHISSGTESEALAQQQALLPKQQNALRYSEAAHHHDAHLGLHLQKYERKIHGASEETRWQDSLGT